MKSETIELSRKLVMEAVTAKLLYFHHFSREQLWHHAARIMDRQPPNQRYFITSISNMQRDRRLVEAFREHHTPYLTLSDDGRKWLRSIQPTLLERLRAVQSVAAAIDYDITADGKPPGSIEVLEGADRSFFSTIIKTMDLFRYYVLWVLLHEKKSAVMADIQESIAGKFGWQPSKAYVYKLALQMEEAEEGALIKGAWDDPRIRHRRYWQITTDGRAFFPVLEQRAAEQIRNAYHFLDDVIAYIEKEQ
ncbi:hypothetical protein [Salibacterium aidingense]|uniref:hypothetical protein n=1 Tax=Salibacterium aidingense TaxID=384933 RepID=UPI0004060872|nr:hypothetical protein [Salibacterium aidingense]